MKTTLQIRLITIMVVASIFLISAFAAIQVNNQMHRVREFNILRAKQAAFIAMEKLYDIFSPLEKRKTRTFILSEIKDIFMSILDSDMIETAVLLDKKGKPIVLEGDLRLFFEDDEAFLEEISGRDYESKWIIPVIDKKRRIGSLFVKIKNPYNYIVKLTFSLSNLQQVLNEVYRSIFLIAFAVIAANVLLSILLSRILISPVKLINEASRDIAIGNLDRKISIKTKDELEDVANTFNYMSNELRKMKAIAENANPLTKLPGNIVIQEKVEKRIKKREKFVLVYCDLDNFKALNDQYGLHTGDEVIMLTAEIFKEAIAKEGRKDDFIGHEGGDDFLLLTIPDRVKNIAAYIISEFDKRIRNFYEKDDLARGYIEAESRDRKEIKKFPIMTISLAGVSNLEKEIRSYAHVTNVAAEIKRAAKHEKGSKLLIDRRVIDLGFKYRGKHFTSA